MLFTICNTLILSENERKLKKLTNLKDLVSKVVKEDVKAEFLGKEKDIDKMVTEYHEVSGTYNETKKKRDALNSELKEELLLLADKKYVSGAIEASLTPSTKTTMNEVKLLARLKELGLTEAIRTVEQPDTEKLAELIALGKLNANELKMCMDSKTSFSLKTKILKAPKAPAKKRGAKK